MQRSTTKQSLGVKGSLRYRSATWQLDAATYSNTVSGFIYLQPTQPVFTIRGAFPGFRYAQADARLRGVELASSYAGPAPAAPGQRHAGARHESRERASRCSTCLPTASH
jgi:hypothetical protein